MLETQIPAMPKRLRRVHNRLDLANLSLTETLLRETWASKKHNELITDSDYFLLSIPIFKGFSGTLPLSLKKIAHPNGKIFAFIGKKPFTRGLLLQKNHSERGDQTHVFKTSLPLLMSNPLFNNLPF